MKKIALIIISVFTLLSAASEYEMQFEKGKILYYDGNKEEALKVFQKIINTHPEDVDALLFRGRIFAQLGYYEIAIGDFKYVLSLTPDYLDAYSALTTTYFWAGDLDNAKMALSEWISREPENPDAYLLAAKIAISSYNFTAGRNYLELAGKYGADPDEIEELLKSINMPKRETNWSVGASFEYLAVDQDRPDWSQLHLFVTHDFDEALVTAEINRYRRNDLDDHTLVLNTFFDVWERAYMNARLQLGVNGNFMPVVDITTEIFQAVGTRNEPALGFRIMNYDSTTAYLPSIAWAAYPGRFYIRDKISMILRGNINWQNQLTIRYFINDLDTYVQFMNVIGTDFNVFDNSWVFSRSFALSGSWAVDNNYLLNGVLSWTRDENNLTRAGFLIGLAYRW
jgi:YaiO family outer membrane protein